MAVFRYYPENLSAHDKELEKKIIRHSFFFAIFFVALFWLVEIMGEIFGLDLTKAGIFPLTLRGLPGILTSPFIHSGYNHLLSNSLPFFVLLFALVYYYRSLSYRIYFQLYLLAGLCVWLAGRPAWHIGASGVVYALAAFHFTSGVIRNDLRLLVISVVVVFLYGGMVWGVLPLKPEISWESHLWGAVSGILLAIYYRRFRIRRQKFDWEEEQTEDSTDEMENLEDVKDLRDVKEIKDGKDAVREEGKTEDTAFFSPEGSPLPPVDTTTPVPSFGPAISTARHHPAGTSEKKGAPEE